MTARLLVEDRTDRVVVRMNRPEVRNALDLATVHELHEVCADLETRPRPLLLTGRGPDFVAGADIDELIERGRDEALQGINSRLFDRVLHLPMPVVGLLHGHVLGGGAELAYACDVRLATPDVRIGNTEPAWGIMPAAGATWRLKDLVGEPVAKEMLLVGSLLDAERAHASGLVMRVVEHDELEAAGHEVVDRILQRSATATRLTKAVFHTPPGSHPVIDDIAQAVLFDSDDKRDRMQRFLDRRASR